MTPDTPHVNPNSFRSPGARGAREAHALERERDREKRPAPKARSLRTTTRWRVRWRRELWLPTSSTNSRTFNREGDARAFAAKLAKRTTERGGALVHIAVDRQVIALVTPWEAA